MKTAVTHQGVSDDVSVDRVNRVNREQHGDRPGGETVGRTGRNGGQVWRNIGSFRTLLARAERELAGEPGAYVAVVHGDKREEQAGRGGWAGSREAGAQVAGMGARVASGDRGLRVRVHREGGALVGSTLLRGTIAASEARLPSVDDTAVARDANRIAAVEAQLAALLERVAAQGREITVLTATIEEMGPVNIRMSNLHARLDDVEAVAHRHVEDEDEVEDEVEDERDGIPDDDDE